MTVSLCCPVLFITIYLLLYLDPESPTRPATTDPLTGRVICGIVIMPLPYSPMHEGYNMYLQLLYITEYCNYYGVRLVGYVPSTAKIQHAPIL